MDTGDDVSGGKTRAWIYVMGTKWYMTIKRRLDNGLRGKRREGKGGK